MNIDNIVSKAKLMGLKTIYNDKYTVLINVKKGEAYLYSSYLEEPFKYNDVSDADISRYGYLALHTRNAVIIFDGINGKMVGSIEVFGGANLHKFICEDSISNENGVISGVYVGESELVLLGKNRSILGEAVFDCNTVAIIKRRIFKDREAILYDGIALLSRDGSRLLCKSMYTGGRMTVKTESAKSILDGNMDVLCKITNKVLVGTLYSAFVACKYDYNIDAMILKHPISFGPLGTHTFFKYNGITEVSVATARVRTNYANLRLEILYSSERGISRVFHAPTNINLINNKELISYLGDGLFLINCLEAPSDRENYEYFENDSAYLLYNYENNKVIQFREIPFDHGVSLAKGMQYTVVAEPLTVSEDLRHYVSQNNIDNWTTALIDKDGRVRIDENIIWDNHPPREIDFSDKSTQYIMEFKNGKWRFFLDGSGEEVDLWQEYM